MLREYAGAAKRTALSGDITAASTTITVADATGYPTGATGPFAIALSQGQAAEEKILVTSRSGNTLTINTRGYDGTTASNHSSGATIDHVLTAIDVREANEHINDTTDDPHADRAYTDAELTAHEAAADPHPGYLTAAEAGALFLTPTEGSAAFAPKAFAGARVHKSAAQSVANATWTALTWEAETADTGAFHDTAANTSRLMIQVTGWHDINASARWASNATGARSLAIRLNGTTYLNDSGFTLSAGAGVGTRTMVGLKRYFTAGDYIEIMGNQQSGGALNVEAGADVSFADIQYLGA